MRTYLCGVLLLFTMTLFSQKSPNGVLRQADSLFAAGEYASAAPLYEQLQAAFRQKSASNQYLAVTIQLAVCQQQNNDYPLSKTVLRQAITATPQATDSLLALAHHKLGVAHYYLDDYFDAVAHFDTALHVRQRIFSETHPDIIKGLHNIGDSYQLAGQYDRALEYLQSSLRLHQQAPERVLEQLARTYRVLGTTYDQMGNVQQAEQYLFAGLQYYEQLYAEEPWNLAGIYLDLAVFYLQQRRGRVVVYYAQQARAQFDQIADADKYDEDWIGLAKAYNNEALGYELQKSYDKAIDSYSKALQINQRFGEAQRAEIAKIYNNLAYVYRNDGRPEQGIAPIEKAIAIGKQLELTGDLADFLHTKATLLNDLRQAEQALQTQQQAIQLAVPGFNPADNFENPPVRTNVRTSKINFVEYLDEKARSLQLLAEKTKQPSYLQTALETYEVVAVFLDSIRQDVRSDASKRFITQRAKPILEGGLRTARQLWQQRRERVYLEQAFQFAERSKAIILLEAVQGSGAKQRAGISLALLQREQRLKTKINDLKRRQTNENNPKLNDQLILLESELQALLDTFEQQYPNYFQLKYQLDLVTIDHIQQALLQPDQAMITYFLGQEKLYTFYLTPNMATILEQPIGELEEQIREMRRGIEQGAFAEVSLLDKSAQQALNQTYADNAWQLYQLLLGSLLKTAALPDHLIIIPDGELGFLPFDALLTEAVQKAGNNFATYPFLVKKHRISYSYSATLLERNRQDRHDAKARMLAFAPTFVAQPDVQLDSLRSALQPLLHNQAEVEAIADIFPAQTFFGQRANRATFLRQADAFSYLHLSTHALVNDSLEAFSFVAFAQHADTLDEQEVLYLNDLYNLPLQAEMVVLSACETGIGEVAQGEGVMSIARAFSYAGASSVLATLWSVNDRATRELVIAFYENLAEEQTKVIALRQAKLALIEQQTFAHPYYWSGLVAYGNMQAVEKSGSPKWYLLAGLGVVLLMGLFGWWRTRLD